MRPIDDRIQLQCQWLSRLLKLWLTRLAGVDCLRTCTRTAYATTTLAVLCVLMLGLVGSLSADEIVDAAAEPSAFDTSVTPASTNSTNAYEYQAPPPPAPAASSSGGKVVWNNGLFFEHPDTMTKVHVGGLIQQDWVFFGESQSLLDDVKNGDKSAVGDLQDGVFFRRARFKFDGTAYGIMEWDMDAELLSSSAVTFDDLWIGLKQLPVIGNVRVGHVKLPQGLESITSNRVFTFVERATIFDAFFREYGPGMLAFNQYAENNATWAACFHRIDAASDGSDTGDGEYAGTGRLTFIPFSDENDRRLLHIGGSASIRDSKFDADAKKKIVRLRSRPEVRDARILPFFVDTGKITADSNTILAAESAWVDGPFSLQAEYAASLVSNPSGVVGATGDDAWFHGYYVQASYFLTGEHRAYDRRLGRFARVIPRTSAWTVDPTSNTQKPSVCWGSGAWEVAARYSQVSLNDAGISGGRLSDVTLGVNWYLNPNFRIQWNYLYSDRQVAAPQNDGTAHAFVMRFSLDL